MNTKKNAMEENIIEHDTPSPLAKKEEPNQAGDPGSYQQNEEKAEANDTSASTNSHLDHSHSNKNDTNIKFDVRNFLQSWDSQGFDDFGRESLGIINFDLLDYGRPSLAIVNLRSIDPSVPSVVISPPKENMEAVENRSYLNTGLVLPNNNSSLSSSISSFCSRDPCFSKSLNCSELSTISNLRSTLHKMDSSSDALGISTSQFEKLHVSDLPKSSDIGDFIGKDYKRRIHSVPDYMKLQDGIIDSMDGPIDSDPLSFLVKNEDLSNDVFLDYKSAVPKFSTRLMGEDSPNLLDCTPQPDEFFELFEDNGQSAISKTADPEDIFKSLDKMMPPPSFIPPLKAATEAGSRTDGISPKHIPDASNEETSIKHSSDPKLNDARKMLHSLSLIINKDDFADEQKTQVQVLLKSLNSLFSVQPDDLALSVNSNDSGHSSINVGSGCTSSPVVLEENAESTTKICSQPVEKQLSPSSPLDLSHKSKSVCDGDISFNVLTKSSANKTMPSLSLNPSISKTRSITKLLVKSKELSKKSSDTRKGPMKAVVPVSSMPRADASASSTQVTPKRNERRSLTFKKTSTPIAQRPVAQSTPEGSVSKSLNRPNASTYSQRVYPTSPLSSRSTYLRTASADNNKMNNSRTSSNTTPGSIKRDSNYPGYLRRRSTDLKSSSNGCAPGKDNVLLPIQMTNNVGKSPYNRNVKLVGNKNKSAAGENVLVKNNLGFSTGRLYGKENVKY